MDRTGEREPTLDGQTSWQGIPQSPAPKQGMRQGLTGSALVAATTLCARAPAQSSARGRRGSCWIPVEDRPAQRHYLLRRACGDCYSSAVRGLGPLALQAPRVRCEFLKRSGGTAPGRLTSSQSLKRVAGEYSESSRLST